MIDGKGVVSAPLCARVRSRLKVKPLEEHASLERFSKAGPLDIARLTSRLLI